MCVSVAPFETRGAQEHPTPLTTEQTIAAVLAVTFAAGVMQLLLGVMGMGLLLASLMSWPVMSAFLAGAAIITVASQV